MARILIIDDDPDIVDSLSMILETRGHLISTKPNTEALITDVMAFNPDLIILDIIFPEDPQAGFAASRMLHKHEKTKNIPVLLLSAVNRQSKLSFGFSEADLSDDFMPASAFLEKPVEPETLLKRIDQLLAL